jgi:hypothetical protein
MLLLIPPKRIRIVETVIAFIPTKKKNGMESRTHPTQAGLEVRAKKEARDPPNPSSFSTKK